MTDKIIGEMNPSAEVKPATENLITKEETMFRVDEKGVAIAEKFPIKIYDRNLERELIEESLVLMETLKRQSAIQKALVEVKNISKKEIKEMEDKCEAESDEKVKVTLRKIIVERINADSVEDVKSRVNFHVVEDSIKESREMLQSLNKEKDKQMVKKFVKLRPCNNAESTFSFEKGMTIEGEKTTDWVADLISKKIVEPTFTLEEAKLIKPDFKIALKESIMEASNYKVKSYRDIMLRTRMEQVKPLTLKKEKTTGENTAPAESAS